MRYRKGGILLTLSLCMLFYSCQKEKPVDITLMDSLVGKWILPDHSQDHRTYIEEWSKENDSTYTGNAYVLNQNTDDKFNTEMLWIEYRNGWWTYTAEPKGQQRTPFKLTELTPDRFRFINPSHDFPKYIEYQFSSKDSIRAEIGDDSSRREFRMVRLD